MSTTLQPGDVLVGKYRVERVLGEGGMGLVLAAYHLQLDQRVAIKVVHPQALQHADVVARFIREARASVRIRSEHVVRVLDVGELPDGTPFMVMEYLDGRDLSQVLQQWGRLPVEEAVGYMLQACEAIGEAHSLGIVHRDLKPPNLFLSQGADGNPIIKVLDFGISKSLATTDGPQQVAMTSTSMVMGSPLYMSPEQAKSAKSVDGRTDIWSLGAILFELLTGRPPFDAENIAEVFAMILHAPAPSARAVRRDVPAALDAVMQRCLAKDPAARFANVGEFAQALVAFAPMGRESAERTARVLRVAAAAGRASITNEAAAGSGSYPLPGAVGASTAGPWTPPTKGFAQTAETLSPPREYSFAKILGAGVLGTGVVAFGIITVLRLSHGGSAAPVSLPTAAGASSVVVTATVATASAHELQADTALTSAAPLGGANGAPSAAPANEKHLGGNKKAGKSAAPGKPGANDVPLPPPPVAPAPPAADPVSAKKNPLDMQIK